jgi:antitoxin component YwqK of YwqJK toxin-antitoxin module
MVKIKDLLLMAGVAGLVLIATGCGGRACNDNDQSVVGQTYVHKYGVAVPSNYWTTAGESGAVVSTMADGVVVSRSYSSGTLDGETNYTYPHSTQLQKCEYYDWGTLTKDTEYYFDGTPKREVKYNAPEDGMRTVSTWYLSGTPRSIERYQGDSFVSGESYTPLNQVDASVVEGRGSRLNRDDYGQLLSTDTIDGGQMVMRQTYYPNGSPKETIPYRNGQVEGVKRSFLPGGEPDTVEQWSAGQQHGMATVYQHGDKFADVPYVNGDKHGVECRYRDGAVKVQEISWCCGQMHGPMITYVGDNTKTEWYFKGSPTTKADYDFRTNRPALR